MSWQTLGVLFPLVLFALKSDPEPLLRAHAHNDYEHARPLLDALDQGFCSVEADIYLVDGELRVGHNRKDLVAGRTLEALYLDPLLARVKAHHGHVYDKFADVTLLIDIKEDGEAVYAELRKRLPKYGSMLTEYAESLRIENLNLPIRVRKRAVTIILSGDRPIETVRKEKQRYAFIDGRLSDLEAGVNPFLMPLVSDNFYTAFKPNTQGELSAEQSLKFRMAVEHAHLADVRIRFWGTPDKPAMWKSLYDAGVDLLNTDDLPGLAAFLRSQATTSPVAR